MLTSPIEVSELIRILSSITKIDVIQHAAWIVSFLAILTSIIGVGLSLNEILKRDLEKFIENHNIRHLVSSSLMIVPPSIIAIVVPNAFIRVLSFAGIILAIIAIILPAFLFTRMRKTISRCDNLKIFAICVVGVVIIILGILDIFK